MKKSLKKMKLSRETVRQLNGPGLGWVVGVGFTQFGFECTNESGFCVSLTCRDFCGSETSVGANACVCESVKNC